MKKILFLINSLLITVTMAAQKDLNPAIEVTGEGIVYIIPDGALITVRVEHSGNDAKEVKKQNDQVINEVFQFLKTIGIENRHVKTEYINLSKSYDYNRKIHQYLANQTLKINLKDLKKYESLMNGLIETGINRIEGVQFTSSQMDQLESQARIKAIENAKQKAVEYAGAVNQTVGKAIYISEFSQHSITSVYKQARLMDTGNAEQTIAPGELEIKATVNVSFVLL